MTRPGRTGRAAALVAAAALAALGGSAMPAAAHDAHGAKDNSAKTTTPIKHVVVLFDENISFDHYFATYPKAANTDGTPFEAAKHTPKANNLANAGLLTQNPNQYLPSRLGPAQAMTCSQNHSYGPEQYAYDNGKSDKFVENTEQDKCSGGLFAQPGMVMDYYDGNTTTAIWNYAQHYTLGDNSFSSTYGPSTPGALNLVSGQTHGVVSVDATSGTDNPKQTATPSSFVASPNAQGVGTLSGDTDPAFDDCSDNNHASTGALAEMTGKNIGDLLNAKGVSWGWFQGGFRPSTPWDGTAGSYAKCQTTHTNVGGAAVTDYSPHHSPFEYYKSTANPHHLAPASVDEIGHNGRANHNYDLTDFDAALAAQKLPAVSFLKAAAYQDAHPGNSDPLDEQNFLVSTINKIQQSPEWKSTAVVIAYDDSDGWYDHVAPPVLNGSTDTKTGSNGLATDSPACQSGPAAVAGYQDRCGPGPRQPLLVISPYSKTNHIDHTPTEQASITSFIEQNWKTGKIGDGSFDQRAGTLDNAFDFQHPNKVEVLLGSNGAVSKVAPFPKKYPAPVVQPISGPAGGGVDTAKLASASASSTGTSALLPVTAGVAAVVAMGGMAWGLRRRQSRTGA
ncbi:phospholipase C [Actinacidiphila acididurans]|uniref:Alkaline phosphatase family protein n=1 Tax=Actinacidiphila acididurans TaxID=2784346 RepID=A0ABS2TMT5_9ACTN|nr:alkaline phosphatase family protein [Actinacidiphila acididurans]MBM9504301.1 alkaline phosphatase family protein [Actinacidiphila acididurans]